MRVWMTNFVCVIEGSAGLWNTTPATPAAGSWTKPDDGGALGAVAKTNGSPISVPSCANACAVTGTGPKIVVVTVSLPTNGSITRRSPTTLIPDQRFGDCGIGGTMTISLPNIVKVNPSCVNCAGFTIGCVGAAFEKSIPTCW